MRDGPAAVGYHPRNGYASEGIIHIRPLKDAISLSRPKLTRCYNRFHGSRAYTGENEYRKDLRHIFNTLIAPPVLGRVEMDHELNLRDMAREEWDAMPEVRRMRDIFDQETAARDHQASVSASTSTSTTTTTTRTGSGTTRKSKKYGPTTPDLATRLLERDDELSVESSDRYRDDRVQVGAIGELRFNSYTPDEVAKRDAQLLEATCQIIWYLRCGSKLFGLRMGILIINGEFKRFFVMDETRLAVEVDVTSTSTGSRSLAELLHSTPRRSRSTSRRTHADHHVLRRGMGDEQCRQLCTLPNRLFRYPADAPTASASAAPDPAALATNATDQTFDPPAGYNVAALDRLMGFWATGLERTSKLQHDRPRLAGLQPLDPSLTAATTTATRAPRPVPNLSSPRRHTSTSSSVAEMPCLTFDIAEESTAQVGRLKHHYHSLLGANDRAAISKRKRSVVPPDTVPSALDRDRDDDDHDTHRDGSRNKGGGIRRRTGRKSGADTRAGGHEVTGTGTGTVQGQGQSQNRQGGSKVQDKEKGGYNDEKLVARAADALTASRPGDERDSRRLKPDQTAPRRIDVVEQWRKNVMPGLGFEAHLERELEQEEANDTSDPFAPAPEHGVDDCDSYTSARTWRRARVCRIRTLLEAMSAPSLGEWTLCEVSPAEMDQLLQGHDDHPSLTVPAQRGSVTRPAPALNIEGESVAPPAARTSSRSSSTGPSTPTSTAAPGTGCLVPPPATRKRTSGCEATSGRCVELLVEGQQHLEHEQEHEHEYLVLG